MSQPVFEIFRSVVNQEYYFRLRAMNGKTVLSSKSYQQRFSCEKGIESVRINTEFPARFRKTNAVGNYNFVLCAANGECIGRSECYTTAAARDNGIRVVQLIAAEARVHELA
jgi:uncharacterized protein